MIARVDRQIAVNARGHPIEHRATITQRRLDGVSDDRFE